MTTYYPINVIGPMDQNNMNNGPFRMISSPVRMGSVTLDTPYGEAATWLYVGTTGNVSIVKWDGTTQVLNAMNAGVWHRVCSLGVTSANTSASNLVWGS